jgi:hypothetical protein
MAKYLVTYDLVGTEEASEDYRRLIAELKGYEKCIKLQKSVWAIDTVFDSGEVRDQLREHMDDDDRLLVVPIRRGAAWRRLICGTDAYKEFSDS